MLLKYLTKSKARRELLRLLWGAGTVASVSALARKAGVPFSAAHRELEGMREAGLARSERVGKEVVYRAQTGSPSAAALRALLAESQGKSEERTPSQPGDDLVRAWLRYAGAPLLDARPLQGPPAASLEEALAHALELAHRDPTVALVLPVVLWRQRARLRFEPLMQRAARHDERHTLGFFLDLTAQLGGGPGLRRFREAARAQRDTRRRRPRLFFAGHHGRFARDAAKRNSPAVARKWGFEMNMPLDSFQSTFTKHTRAGRMAMA